MDETEWVLINLDEKMARRQGLPKELPVPKSEFEGLADQGLAADKARKWASDFLNNSEVGKSSAWRKKQQKTFLSMQAFIDKGPMIDKAQKAFAQNDFDKAIKELKRITVLDDDDDSAKLNLASAYANTKNFDGALKLFLKVKPTYEGDPDYHVALGQIYLATRDTEAATNEMVLALEAKPDHQVALDALVQLGILTKVYENPKDATTLLYVRADAVLEYLVGEWDKEPRAGAFFLEQADYHEREGRHEVVLAAAERARKAFGEHQNERAETLRIGALRTLGKKEEARDSAAAYAEAVPSSAAGFVALAECERALGNEAAAKRAIERAIAAEPGDLAAISLALWPDDDRDIAQVNAALPALLAHVEAHPAQKGAQRSLARAYLVVGRNDDAFALFEKAIAIDPKDDDLRSEYWAELGKVPDFARIVKDAESLDDMKTRDWRLRWNEAEAYLGLGKRVEARALFSALNFDENLHVDVRRRAKRAVRELDEGTPPQGSPPQEAT